MHAADGASQTGPLLRMRPGWAVELGGDKPAKVAGAEVVTLRRAGAALPERPRAPHILLANGDQLPGEVQALAGEVLRFRARCGEERELKLPLTGVTLLWLAAPEGVSQADAFRRRLATGKRKHDTIYLRNGDVVEGIVNALDRTRLQVEVNRKDVTIDVPTRVAVIAFSTDLVRQTLPKGPYAWAVLANGGRVALASAEADAHELRGKTVLGAELRIPVEQLVALDLRQGRAVYLSDLQPSRYEYTPFLDDRWPYVRDGSVLDRDLRLDGSTYDKGLGLHSASRLSFDLAGGYRRFEATVGLDDASGRKGSAGVEVWIDGKPRELGEPILLSAQEKPRSISLDVRGARELTLVVTFGRGGHVQDHVDWADARLIR